MNLGSKKNVYVQTVLYVTITSYNCSKTRKHEGENTGFSIKRCSAIHKQIKTQVADHGVLSSCKAQAPPASYGSLRAWLYNQEQARQWLPNPLLCNRKTTCYTETRSSYPTATSQATFHSFSQVSASTRRHWCAVVIVNYLCSTCKNSARTTVPERQPIASVLHLHDTAAYPSTSKDQQLLTKELVWHWILLCFSP